MSRANAYRHRSEQGAALIIVLVVVSFVSIAAVTISEQNQLGIYLGHNQRDAMQANQYLYGAELRSKLLLTEIMSSSRTNLSQNWATSRQRYEIERGLMQLKIRDLRTCFNLNSLSDQLETRGGKGLESEEVKRLRYLMTELGISGSEQNLFVYRLIDWLDPDDEVSEPYGRELDDGGGYRPANTALVDLDELLLIGIPSNILELIDSSVCVLPSGAGNQLNINTLTSPQLLSAYSLGMINTDQARTIIEMRPGEGYESKHTLYKSLPEGLKKVMSGLPITLNSQFFAVDIAVKYGSVQKNRSIQLWLSDEVKTIRRVNRDG